MSLGDYADSNDGRGIIYALEAIELQLKAANLLALQRFQDAHDLMFPTYPVTAAADHDGFDHCLSCQAVYQTKQANA